MSKSRNSAPSIRHQINRVLEELVWDKEQIDAYKAEHQVDSVKKALRPGGDPTAGLPVILSVRTKACYLQTGTTFFNRARELSGKKLLKDLLTPEVILLTLDAYYIDLMPATNRTVLAALNKIFLGCHKMGWVKGRTPITQELRKHVRDYRDDGDVRRARFGYQSEDALEIVKQLWETGSKFALPAEIALRMGLRLSEIAGLKGEDIEPDILVLHVRGKGGRHRALGIPMDLLEKLNLSQQYLFTPSPSWKSSFYQAVRNMARKLGITVSGVHRLRANGAQNLHAGLQEQGLPFREADKQVSQWLGHSRISVVRSYVEAG
jgi:integrase